MPPPGYYNNQEEAGSEVPNTHERRIAHAQGGISGQLEP